MNNKLKRIIYILIMLFYVTSWLSGIFFLDNFLELYLLRGVYTSLVIFEIPFNLELTSSVFWIALMALTTIAHFKDGTVKNWIIIILILLLFSNVMGISNFIINVILIVLTILIAENENTSGLSTISKGE